MKNIGKRLLQLRVRKQLTQAKMATLVGKTQEEIYKYENGRRVPTTQSLEDISKGTGCNLNWLVMGEGEMFLSKKKIA